MANTRGMPEQPRLCYDCGAEPGCLHVSGCDTEQCSVCGLQWIVCGHKGHDSSFARWTGYWPGALESRALGINMNEFHARGLNELFFVKPTGTDARRGEDA
jgi:hypothetical protein